MTGLARLLQYGLMGGQDYKNLEIEEFIKTVFEFVYTKGAAHHFDRALGAYFSDLYKLGVFKKDADDDLACHKCVQEAKKVPLDKAYWSSTATDTYMYLENVCHWHEYTLQEARARQDNEKFLQDYVEAKLAEFDFSRALEKEAASSD